MYLKRLLLCFLLAAANVCFGQDKKPVTGIDTTVYDYDEIFSELDILLDSLYTPRSFLVVNASAGNNFFNFTKNPTDLSNNISLFVVSPGIGYFHKSGLGISASSSVVYGEEGYVPFQYSFSGSFDYLKKKTFIAGVSYSRIFTEKGLNFYTSPLQNEGYAYFTYRDHWLKPSVSGTYGWGSRQSVQLQEESIRKIKKKGAQQSPSPTPTPVTTNESVVDFNLIASVRHDFYLKKLLSQNDYLRLTPQLSFTSGTQQYGFNSVASPSAVQKRNGRSVLSSVQNITLDDKLTFQPLSVTMQFRTEYAKGKFFVQPQVFLDYYIPTSSGNFTTSFLVNIGYIF
jgi:hypothetical protein